MEKAVKLAVEADAQKAQQQPPADINEMFNDIYNPNQEPSTFFISKKNSVYKRSIVRGL